MPQAANDSRLWRGWYKTARWQRIRTAQLSGEPLCSRCLAMEVVEPATVVHHVTPHKGDPDLFWNGPFESLCKPHHDSDGQHEDHGRTVVRYGADGWPL